MGSAPTLGLLLTLLTLDLTPPGQPSAVSRLWGSLQPGPSRVGFSVHMEKDAARSTRSAPRAIQTACWYPAATGGSPMTFADYFALASEENGTPATEVERAAAVATLKTQVAQAAIPAAAIDDWLSAPMTARRDARPASGSHSLVLIAQGNNHSVHNQAVLGEFLGSHAYVVCTSPSQSRLSEPMQSDTDVLPHARAQAADLQIVARSAATRFQIDGDPAVVAHSFGARSALLFAADNRVAAFVSLDGGIGAAHAISWLDTASTAGATTIARVRVPLLHIFETTDPQMAADFTLLRALPVKPVLVRIDGLHHWDFSALGTSSVAVPALRGEPAPGDLAARLAAIADLTLRFLDEHVRGDRAAARRFSAFQAPWLHRPSL